MKIAVWDTYVQREDGKMMHFDILVDSSNVQADQVLELGRHYLGSKSFATDGLTARECRFCHIEEASPELVAQILLRNHAIVEMENCD
jgi:hypothetical protein